MTEKFIVRDDCRSYLGYKPCRPGKVCGGCADYDPVGERIIVVKLAAAGDVIRTTPLLTAIKREYPRCWITWLTDTESVPLLLANPLIDELLPYSPENAVLLMARRFEWLIILDKEPRAIALSGLITARRRSGFGMNPAGKVTALDDKAAYALRLGLDDELKFKRNRATYPRLVFEMLGLTYHGEPYVFAIPEAVSRRGRTILEGAGWRPESKTIGLNTGCGETFATKKWSIEGFAELAESLIKDGFQVVLLGGPQERERNRLLAEELGSRVIDAGTTHPIDVFAGILSWCQVVVTADTLALHLAIGLRREVVLLMGPTAPAEIDLFGRGEIIFTGIDCAPCYRQYCPKEAPCMAEISSEQVRAALNRCLDRLAAEGI